MHVHGANPLRVDTDGDGLSDGLEINNYQTNPLVTDSDGDGFRDGFEVSQGSNPAGPDSIPNNIAMSGTAILGTKVALDSGDGRTQQVADMIDSELRIYRVVISAP